MAIASWITIIVEADNKQAKKILHLLKPTPNEPPKPLKLGI
jgi:hypothetical protein